MGNLTYDQVTRLAELVEEEKGIADVIYSLDLSGKSCGIDIRCLSHIATWIYRHQKTLQKYRINLNEETPWIIPRRFYYAFYFYACATRANIGLFL